MDLHLSIVAILEGVIEFLPISSTAHLIIASKLLNIDTADSFIKFYLLVIQLGALFAGIILFSKKIFKNKTVFTNICISFIPSAVVGFIFYKMFKKLLEGNMIILAIMSLIGGLIFIYLEKVYMRRGGRTDLLSFGREHITKLDAFVIGLAQAIAIIPGVSRSGATIIAGIFRGIKRSVIFEYTFMLAIPTLGAAVSYDAYKNRDLLLGLHSWDTLLYGFFVSFVVSFLVLYFLEKHISRISLTMFGWYRILIAILVLNFFVFNISPSVIVNNDTKEESAISPELQVSNSLIYPGDPVMITIVASTTPKEMLFNTKVIPSFEYNGKYRGLLAIPFEETKLNQSIKVTLENGVELKKDIVITPREKIEKPLAIPEKLGGNTKEAGKALVNNLAKENAVINNIKSSPNRLWDKVFAQPLKTLFVTDDYGYNRDTVGYVIVHKGTDFRAKVGTEVMAMNDGVVKISDEYTVYGKTIVIDHGLGLNTLYMHMSDLKVKQGDTVKVGQVIGYSGMTGYAESPHLHLSIKLNGVSIDPVKFMNIFGIMK
jgi:undecaprenyl-diphosphatase